MESDRVDLSTFLNERCRFYQLKDGFRFGTDTFLLTDFIRIKGKERIIDLGTGCGVIPILLLLKYKELSAVGIDVAKENVEIARENARINGVEDRIKILKLNVKNVKKTFKPHSFDIVVTNPPFIEVGKGSISTKSLRALARQEIEAKLEDFIEAARFLLKNRGKFYLLLPVHRFTDAITLMREKKIEPKRLRFLYPCPERGANLFLIEGVKGGGKGIVIEPPLVVYSNCQKREYTEEVRKKYMEFFNEEKPNAY